MGSTSLFKRAASRECELFGKRGSFWETEMNRSVMKIWSKTGVRVAFATVGDDLGVQSIEPIFLMPADGQGVDAWQSEHVPALSALLPCRSPRPACAHGKVCLLDV